MIQDLYERLFEVNELIETIGKKETNKLEMDEPVPEKIMKYIKKISHDLDGAIKELSVRGRGEKLKTNKPKNGIYAYVWRMARFNSGDDIKMPITAVFDLSQGIEDKFGISINFAITRGKGRKEILQDLEELADKVLVKLGRDKFAAAKRWSRALGHI